MSSRRRTGELTGAARDRLSLAVLAADMPGCWKPWVTINDWRAPIEAFVETWIACTNTKAAKFGVKQVKRAGPDPDVVAYTQDLGTTASLAIAPHSPPSTSAAEDLRCASQGPRRAAGTTAIPSCRR